MLLRRGLVVFVLLLATSCGVSWAAKPQPTQFVTPSGTPYDSLNRTQYNKELRRLTEALAEVDTLKGEYESRIIQARRELVDRDDARDRTSKQQQKQQAVVAAAKKALTPAETAMFNERDNALGTVRQQTLDAEASVRWVGRIRNGVLILLLAGVITVGIALKKAHWRRVGRRHVMLIAGVLLLQGAAAGIGRQFDTPHVPKPVSAETVALAKLADSKVPTPEVAGLRNKLKRATTTLNDITKTLELRTTRRTAASKRLTSTVQAKERLLASIGDKRERRVALESVDKELRARGR
jgi:hypothetical protein